MKIVIIFFTVTCIYGFIAGSIAGICKKINAVQDPVDFGLFWPVWVFVALIAGPFYIPYALISYFSNKRYKNENKRN